MAAEVPAGGAVVFSSLTPHLTGPNTTDAVRKAYILQYAPDGAEVLRGDPNAGPPATPGGGRRAGPAVPRRAGRCAVLIAVNGVELAVAEHGAGDPLVLVHGFTGSADDWAGVVGDARPPTAG